MTANLTEMANAIRFLSMDAVQKANSGHPGMPMGMADVATVLFAEHMKYDAHRPDWADRDRFILSAGHGSMLLYSLLYLMGVPGVEMDNLKHFRQLGSPTAGHPEVGHLPGVETTTGPLGQGITNAVGMALAERLLAARYGDDVVDHHTYCIAGDGCLMEGLSHEALGIAGHLKLSKLVVLWDDNHITIDGDTAVATSDDVLKRFEAHQWDVQSVDGHNPEEISAAIAKAKGSDKPSLIACRTTIGFGAPHLAGSHKTHGAPLGDDEIAATREALGWSAPPFEIPDNVLNAWREAGSRGAVQREAWDRRLNALPAEKKAEFERTQHGTLPPAWEEAILRVKREASAEKPKNATRKSSLIVLNHLAQAVPELLGGSADLTGSNLTKADSQTSVTPDNMAGNYLHYGIREFGMSAVMNGIALHGGLIPYGGTFLVFSDYMRNGMRLSALMERRVIYVLTHDSIGLGEDGPTHQPIEHVASLRAMPNMLVFRPGDEVETAECWQLALEAHDRPSSLILSRQGMPTQRTEHTDENRCRKGAYVLAHANGTRQATIIGTGSELHMAMEAREQLQAQGIPTAVVSMPCWELFEEQDHAYQAEVLGDGPCVAVEALGTFGWHRWVGPHGRVIGMNSFGASGKAGDLYKHFGITTDAVVDAVKAQM